MSAIEVEGLVKRYGGFTAVAGVSFTAARGQVTALLGPNGAGKTTTIARAARPTGRTRRSSASRLARACRRAASVSTDDPATG